jgi:hypothetical protein
MGEQYKPITKEEVMNSSEDGLLNLKVQLLMGRLKQEWFEFPLEECYDLIHSALQRSR